MLCLAGTMAFILPQGLPLASAQSTGNTFMMTGVMRDFRRTNLNFAVAPVGGNGHSAGNVAIDLPSDGMPVFASGGYKVATEWRDDQNHPIAPHMFKDSSAGSPGVIYLTIAMPEPKKDKHDKHSKHDNKSSKHRVVVDTYNSVLGVYGGSNIGPAPTYQVGAAMPEIVVPASLEAMPDQGKFRAKRKKETIIASNMHCSEFRADGIVKINGDVSILCEGEFEMRHRSQIVMMPGAKLTLYLKGGAKITEKAAVGDPRKPASVRIFNMAADKVKHHGKDAKNHDDDDDDRHGKGHDDDDDDDDDGNDDADDESGDVMTAKHGKFRIRKSAAVHAHVVSPNATMEISSRGSLFGQFRGKAIKYGKDASFHVDTAGAVDGCGQEFKDVAGAKGVDTDGGLVSAARFADWYSDVMGTNLSMPHTITLWKNSAGVFEHINNAFFPLDRKLFANQGQTHNYYFTYAAAADFTHRSCMDKFFEFNGADDAWMFIDGKLVMDRGGVMPGIEQYVDMDRLGLEDGKVYRLNFFYAQRNSMTSVFRMRTNLDLITPSTPVQVQMSMGAD